MAGALYWGSTLIDTADLPLLNSRSSYLLWPLYWFFQGAVCTGLWVLAHECGHQAFSDYGWVNDTVGFVLHSSLLVPYWSWKISHRRHHSNTGSVEKDEVFVPSVRDTVSEEGFEWDQLSIVRLVRLLISLFLGWPLYLMFNSASRPYEGYKWVNHFNPYSPIFSKRERLSILASDLGLVAVAAGLKMLYSMFGGVWLLKTYGVPLIVVNFWLVMITLLQHTHPELPHYKEDSWDWLRGMFCLFCRFVTMRHYTSMLFYIGY